ncbi:LysR family transcriptional regulator [Yoonia maricola]|uniref:LysR family transcriptional regulator n=1 Tax=Yoonia maricola TaxID=420999 RepID=A0A2M8WNX6_9RHOB|nr:LysR family transcriptional regulator [Yoonia maricola]PJI92635.1 LysR family transcriptional regulator [Yoonia maricola]
MSDFNNTQVRRLDFMLLLVLREGVRQRKLSDVAATLGVTQTAISHSVARLRDLFDDELFIRRPHGVEPTARAVELAKVAEAVIESAGSMLNDPTPFDPFTENRTIRVCALDYEVTLMSAAIETLRRDAPGIRLEFRGMGKNAAIEALERNDADLWLGFARQLPRTLESFLLFEETYKVISRRGHPHIAADSAIDLDCYCSQEHVLAAPGGTAGGIVDRTLRTAGRSRTVAVMTTSFLSALDVVSRTDLIATVPSRLAKAQANSFQLMIYDPPVAPRPFQVSATWHKRAGSDAAISWLIKRLADALG